jgi:hypothetical protein
LGHSSEDELDPEEPLPIEEALNGTTNDAANTSTDARRQDDESERKLLVFTLVDIGDKTEGNTTTGGRKTTLQ